MAINLVFRKTTSADMAQILALYPLAFPEEELGSVVSALLEEGSEVLSMGAFDGEALVAHVIFCICGTEETERTGMLLGPLGVMPSRQRQGLGSSLVRAGLDRLEETGVNQVFVLGDPDYYQRFGFSHQGQVLPPYPLSDEYASAWQSMALAGRSPLAAGRLSLPAPWMEPTL